MYSSRWICQSETGVWRKYIELWKPKYIRDLSLLIFDLQGVKTAGQERPGEHHPGPPVGGTPSATPRRPSEAVSTRATVSPNISRGISFDEGGLLMDQAVLVETYMGGRPRVQEEEVETVEETPSGQETSAKESVGDSQRVALRGKKCKHSSECSAE